MELNKLNNTYKGELVGIEDRAVFGWAYNSQNPDEKLVLEVIIDGYPTTLTIANLFCKEYLTDSFGDNCYGFISLLPQTVIKIGHKINIRIANTGKLLDGELLISDQYGNKNLKKDKSIPNLIDSQLIYAGGLKVRGHYYDPVKIDEIPDLHFYDNDTFLFSQSLENQKNGVYQIDINLPIKLADGNRHKVKITDQYKRELKGSPVFLSVFPDGASSMIGAIVKDKNNDHLVNKNIKVLENLLEQYNKYLPASYGFENYHEWAELFLNREMEVGKSKKRLGIIIYGNGDLKKSIQSLHRQNNKNWQAIILDSGDKCYSSKKIHFIENDIFDINTVIKKYKFNYITLLQAGDHLPSNCINTLIRTFEINKSAKILYSDVDFDNRDGGRSNPWFKSDWDYELFLSQNFINELFVVKSENIPSNFSENIALLPPFCVKELLNKSESDLSDIYHIPEVLYHKQYKEGLSGVFEIDIRSNKIIQEIVNIKEPGGKVLQHPSLPYLRKIKRSFKVNPLVSIIIPTRDQAKLVKTCIKSLMEKTNYKNYEILIVDNQSREKKTFKLFKKLSQIDNIRVLGYHKPFNYSAINNYAVKQARGEVVALVNNDIEFKDEQWLDEMLGLLMRVNVGAVGCKLTWPNGMVQHGGVILGVNGLADHAFNTISEDEPGYFYRAQVTQQYSAVTAACLLTRKEDYLSVGGLDEVDFPVAFNDVDFCLKLRAQNKRIVWTPFVKIIHAESVSRGKDDSPEKIARAQKEMNNLKRKWGYELMHDPFYNPNLNLDHLSGPFNGLAIPPRTHFK